MIKYTNDYKTLTVPSGLGNFAGNGGGSGSGVTETPSPRQRRRFSMQRMLPPSP